MTFRPTIAVAAALSAALAAASAQAASFYATTGTGSDVIVIDAANPYSWTFTADNTYSNFHGGVFAMRHTPAPTTTFGIQMELYDVSNTTVLGIASFAIGDFIAAGGNAATYERIVFALTQSLTAGDPYRITLSVTGDPLTDTGSYSVRGTADPLGLAETENPETIALAVDAPATATPEPAAAFVLATGLLGLAATRRLPARARA